MSVSVQAYHLSAAFLVTGLFCGALLALARRPGMRVLYVVACLLLVMVLVAATASSFQRL